jgi:sugar phosphate isomerase/epimerase
LSVLLGNSGSPRWYAAPEHTLDDYLDHLVDWGATSAEMVLHHGPYDERTARVHVIDPDWRFTSDAYHERGIAVQLHVSLDPRFATSRWRSDREGLQREYEPILVLVSSIVERQDRVVLVLHGAADPAAAADDNEAATIGLLDWLANRAQVSSLPLALSLELGAAKTGRESAAARSRQSILRIVERLPTEQVGICWDLAHDCENSTVDPEWTTIPAPDFLGRVNHVHLHDLDGQGMAHYPVLLGNVPYPEQFAALRRVGPLPSITMEVRWLCATRMGEPWTMLGESYRAVWKTIDEIDHAAAP